MTLTPGNTDDRKVVLKLLQGLKVLVVADAGYVKHAHVDELFERGITYIYDVKKEHETLDDKSSAHCPEITATH